MDFVKILRKRSKCIKYQTAAIVTKGTQVIGIGYNGTLPKDKECCDVWYDYWQRMSDGNLSPVSDLEMGLATSDRPLSGMTDVSSTSGSLEISSESVKECGSESVDCMFIDWLKTDEFKTLHSEWSILHEVHAEINALNWVSKKDINETCALYTYYSPCDQCAKQILSYGIKKLYYCEIFPGRTKKNEGLKFLQNNLVECIKVV